MVDDQRDLRIGQYVPHAAQSGEAPALGFGVEDRVDVEPVISEADRNDVRPAISVGRGQVPHRGFGQARRLLRGQSNHHLPPGCAGPP